MRRFVRHRPHLGRLLRAAAALLLLAGLSACAEPEAEPEPSPRDERSGESAPEPSGEPPVGGPPAASITPDMLQAAALSRHKQEYIWDLEHLVFELETFFCAPFVEAIASGDRAGARRRLFDDVRASVLASSDADTIRHGPLTEQRRDAGSAGLDETDADALLAGLEEQLGTFWTIRKKRLRILQIDRSERDGTVYRTTCLLAVQGEQAPSRPMELIAHYEIDFEFADEAAIRTGPLVTRWRALDEVRRTSAKPLLREVTGISGLVKAPIDDNWELETRQRSLYLFQCAVDDFDQDGDLDIAAATTDGRPILLRSGRGLSFTDVAARTGLASWHNDWVDRATSLAIWIDYDDDGYPDLIMGDRLYHNDRGSAFTDVTARSGLSFRLGPMGAAVADYDGDGLLDLYVLYQTPEDDSDARTRPWVGGHDGGGRNVLWRNEGGGVFRDVTAEANASGGLGESFAASWFFFDDDHHPDLYVANDFGPNTLLRNKGDGTFEDLTHETGTGDFSTSMGVATGDLDNDGTPEIYVANMYSKMGRRIIAHVGADDYPPGIYAQIRGSCAGNSLYRRDPGRDDFGELGEDLGVNGVGWAHAPAMVDLDGDGFLDLYATAGFMSFSRTKPDG